MSSNSVLGGGETELVTLVTVEPMVEMDVLDTYKPGLVEFTLSEAEPCMISVVFIEVLEAVVEVDGCSTILLISMETTLISEINCFLLFNMDGMR